jgi:hypothetical protein
MRRFRYRLQALLEYARAQERDAEAQLAHAAAAVAAAGAAYEALLSRRAPVVAAAYEFEDWARLRAAGRARTAVALAAEEACREVLDQQKARREAFARHRARQSDAHASVLERAAEEVTQDANTVLLRQFDRGYERPECAVDARAVTGGEQVQKQTPRHRNQDGRETGCASFVDATGRQQASKEVDPIIYGAAQKGSITPPVL